MVSFKREREAVCIKLDAPARRVRAFALLVLQFSFLCV